MMRLIAVLQKNSRATPLLAATPLAAPTVLEARMRPMVDQVLAEEHFNSLTGEAIIRSKF